MGTTRGGATTHYITDGQQLRVPPTAFSLQYKCNHKGKGRCSQEWNDKRHLQMSSVAISYHIDRNYGPRNYNWDRESEHCSDSSEV